MEMCNLRSSCPINYAVEVIGDKWSLLIIRDMLLDNKSSYSDFLNSDEKIATNILASRLASLEKEGFIKKIPSSVNKARYNYVLTPMAIDLIPLFVDIILWSAEYAPVPVPEEREADLEKAKADRQAFIKEVRQRALQRLPAYA